MADEVKAPGSEQQQTPEQAIPQALVEEPNKEETIGEALEKAEENIKKEEQRMVPEAVLLEYKNQNKELKRDIKELKTLIESGATPREISEDLQAIATEHNVDPNFLKRLARSIKLEAERDMEEKFASDIKPIKERERAERMEVIFNTHYNKAIEVMPEFKDVANREVIKQLTLIPANANKTFAQILQETYGHLVGGKRTMETSRTRRGETIGEIDYSRAAKDSAYFDQIMADPELKKKYNENLGKRLRM